MKILILLLIMFFLPLLSAEILVDIEVKSSFGDGEMISYNYSILSGSGVLVKYTPYVSCPAIPVAFPQELEVQLLDNIPYLNIYEDIMIDESIESQTCTAYVQILEPEEQIIEKVFSITTLPSFTFTPLLCQDSACENETKVFIKGETIYFDYDSEITGPTITATLTLPDESTTALTLPTSIKAEQVGTYELEISASKEGYKIISLTEQFGVIEDDEVFLGDGEEEGEGDVDSRVPGDETIGDGLDGEDKEGVGDEVKKKDYLIYYVVAIVIVFIIIIVIILSIVLRKKETQYVNMVSNEVR